MAYSDCDDSIDPHYSSICDDIAIEHGRIRRGAWLRQSAAAPILVNPTLAGPWNTAVTAGDCIILPELSGTFDGGTPQYGAGYGDNKQKYIASDFKADINDPVYAENWAHYKSLVGKSTWLFVYLTETMLHISGVPVTVGPKNPVTDSVDDSVNWQAEITWTEFFTPKPFLAPMAVFTSATITYSFDTSIAFGSSVTGSAQGVTGTVGATDSDLLLEFNKITTRTGTPVTMNVNVGGVLKITVDYSSDYTGQTFRFTDASAVTHIGTFASGTVNV